MASMTIRFVLTVAFLGSAASLLISAEVDRQVDSAFGTFMAKHGREYLHKAEYDMRKSLFKQRLAEVHAHNAKEGRRWTAAPSSFSDRTEAERKAVRGYRSGAPRANLGSSFLQVSAINQSKPLPESANWMHLKAALDVKDQGSCGSCWAVTTISTLEAHYEIYSANGGKGRTFSAQQTLECTPNPRECGGKGGCEGATVELGMAYILENGLATEEEAPYHAKDAKCSANGKSAPAVPAQRPVDFTVLSQTSPAVHGGAAFGLMSYKTLQSNADYPLAEAVATYGPVAVSADAGSWFEYSSGVFDHCKQDAIIDHAITLYGYGKDGDSKYWLIRNSWGSGWGEKGFIRLLRTPAVNGEEQHCGTDNNPGEGLGCKGGPATVPVCGMCGILFDSVVPHFRGSPGHGGSAPAVSPSFSQSDSANRVVQDESTTRITAASLEGAPNLMRREADIANRIVQDESKTRITAESLSGSPNLMR